MKKLFEKGARLMRVGDVRETNSKDRLAVNWVNYSTQGMLTIMITDPENPNGVFAGKAKLKGTNIESSVFVLRFKDKITAWVVDDDFVEDFENPTGNRIRQALSAFIKGFCSNNIKFIIKNDVNIVFAKKYELIGNDRFRPKHFLLERSLHKSKFQLEKKHRPSDLDTFLA